MSERIGFCAFVLNLFYNFSCTKQCQNIVVVVLSNKTIRVALLEFLHIFERYQLCFIHRRQKVQCVKMIVSSHWCDVIIIYEESNFNTFAAIYRKIYFSNFSNCLQYCSCPTSFLGTEFAAAYRPNVVDFKMKYSSLTRTNLNNSFFSLQVRFCCGKSKVSWTFENSTTRGY